MLFNIHTKKLVFWLVIIMASAFAVSIVLTVIPDPVAALKWNLNSTANVTDEEKSFSLDGIKSIQVITESTNVNVIPADTGNARIHLSGKMISSNKAGAVPELKMTAGAKADKLAIQVNSEMSSGSSYSYVEESNKLDIFVSKGYTGSIRVETVSGSMNIKGLALETFSFKSASGELKADSLTVKDADVKTASGNISAAFAGLGHDVNIESSSGNAKIKLPGSSGFDLYAQTMSGSLYCGFNLPKGAKQGNSISETVGSGGKKVNIKSGSGNVGIYKY